MMKFGHQISRIQIRHPKRVIIIASASVLGALLIAYGVMSYLSWQGYNDRSDEASGALKGNIEKVLGAEKPTATPVAQIDQIISDFEKKYGTNPCQPAPLYRWQTILPALKESETRCNDRFAVALSVIATLKPLSAFLKDQQKAATLVAATLESTKSATDYTAASAAWNTVAESTGLSTSENFKPTSDAIKASAADIRNAFTALSVAIKNEDKTILDSGITALNEAYASLATAATTALEKQTALVTAFTDAYKKL